MNAIPVRLGLLQRVLPVYRRAFFEMLGDACPMGFSILAGDAQPQEAIEPCTTLQGVHLVKTRTLNIGSGRLYLCRQTGVQEWLENWDPEILILEANPRYLHIGSAVRWMHYQGRKVIGWGLGAPGSGYPFHRIWRMVWQRFLHQFDSLITYSQQGSEDYINLGFNPQKIVVAPNAVTPRPQRPPSSRPPTYTDGQPTLLFVGRLQRRKRVAQLIRACAGLQPAWQPRLWIVGDGPERKDLEALAQAIYPTAQFFGVRHGAELDPLFAAADLFVLPGTGGLAVQHAMAYGLPVMVGEADGTQTDLVRLENGWLIHPGGFEELRKDLQSVLENPARLRQMGAESYRIVAEEINLETMLAAFERVIDLMAEE